MVALLDWKEAEEILRKIQSETSMSIDKRAHILNLWSRYFNSKERSASLHNEIMCLQEEPIDERPPEPTK